MRLYVTAALLAIAMTGHAAADVLNSIAERGLIRLGVRADAPPFSYHDPGGAPAGLAIAICENVVKLLARQLSLGSLDIDYVTVTAKDRFPALAEGRTDLHCGPASVTLKRRENLDFSILYFVDGAAAAVRPGTYETVFDEKSGRFGFVSGTTTAAVVKDLIERNEIDADQIEFPSHVAGLKALVENRIDVYFGDQAILLFQIEEQRYTDDIVVMEDIFSFEPYALAMKRGETRLRLAVDRALSSIYARGLIYKMILDELGDYPLPPETRALYQIVGLPE
ncbi:MAG: amino acid ABC transporter substrate-binding protein [Pseudomonadota bacterium]